MSLRRCMRHLRDASEMHPCRLGLLLENVGLVIVMGNTIPLIKWQYLYYKKHLEERECWFGLYPEIIYQAQVTLVWERHYYKQTALLYANDTVVR